MHNSDGTRSALDRIGLLSGAVWVICILAGNSLTEAGAPEGEDAVAAIAYFDQLRGGSHQIGLALELLGFCFLAVFLARLHALLRAPGGTAGWLAGLALVGGVTTLAVKLGSGAFVVVGIAEEDLPGDQAALLLSLNDAAFLLSAMTAGLLLLGVAGSSLISGLLPRWLAALGLLLGTVATLGSLAPSSLDGGPGVAGFLLGLLWLGTTSILLAVRRDRSVSGQDAVPTTA